MLEDRPLAGAPSRFSGEANGRITKVLAAVASLFAFAAVLLAIGKYSFNWPIFEDFIIFDVYNKYVVTHDIDTYGLLFSTFNVVHPIGFQSLVTSLMVSAFGPNAIAMVYFIAVLNGLCALFLYLAIRCEKSRGINLLFFPLIILLLFHPTQTNHLLWPFELGWFLITAFAFANIYCIERFGARALPLIVLTASCASLCSAHGIFLWLGAAFQFFLKAKKPQAYIAPALLLIAFFISVWLLKKHMSSAEGGFSLHELPQLFIYTTHLYGSIFGIRDPQLLLPAGLCLEALAAIQIGLMLFRRGPLSALERTSLTLFFTSFLMLAAFGIGRMQNGLPWVLDKFHAAPLIVPTLVALAVAAGARLEGKGLLVWGRRGLAAVTVVFLGASIVSSLPFMTTMGSEARLHRGLAKHITCSHEASPYLLELINGGPGYLDLIKRDMPLLEPLCAQAVPQDIADAAAFPAAFSEIISRNPAAEEPLKTLWEVYLSHFDLRRAFGAVPAQTPSLLLDFARQDARTGSRYESVALKRHQDYFLTEKGRE